MLSKTLVDFDNTRDLNILIRVSALKNVISFLTTIPVVETIDKTRTCLRINPLHQWTPLLVPVYHLQKTMFQ
mgnify:CR=1 FL=1